MRKRILALIILVLYFWLCTLDNNSKYEPKVDCKVVTETTSLMPDNSATFYEFTQNYDTWLDGVVTVAYDQELILGDEHYHLNSFYAEDDYFSIAKPNYTLDVLGNKACLTTDKSTSGFEPITDNNREFINNNNLRNNVLKTIEDTLVFLRTNSNLCVKNVHDTFEVTCSSHTDDLLTLKPNPIADVVDWEVYVNGNPTSILMTITYTYNIQTETKSEKFTYCVTKTPGGVNTIQRTKCNDYNKQESFTNVYESLFNEGD